MTRHSSHATYERWIEQAQQKLDAGHELTYGVMATLLEFIGEHHDPAELKGHIDWQREVVHEARKNLERLQAIFVKARLTQ